MFYSIRILKFLFLLLLPLFCQPGKIVLEENIGQGTLRKNYSLGVKRTDTPPEINADWNKKIWQTAQIIRLTNYMGEKPSHFPETKVRLLYDSRNIYVIFKVFDRFVRAVEKDINGKVWMDSCVEFFFTPGEETDRGYFNFEANCKGVFLFQYHRDNGETSGFVSLEDCNNIRISNSLKKNVENEISEPVEWCLEYCIPISLMKKYIKVDEPGPGVAWRANFYKCADKSSQPHWLTWTKVDYPRPKFHLPEFFGRIVFE
jgi:hypothetical protein